MGTYRWRIQNFFKEGRIEFENCVILYNVYIKSDQYLIYMSILLVFHDSISSKIKIEIK